MALSDSAEKTPLHTTARATFDVVVGISTIREQLCNMFVRGSRKELGNVVIQWVLVLFQPALSRVLNLCRIVSEHESLAQE